MSISQVHIACFGGCAALQLIIDESRRIHDRRKFTSKQMKTFQIDDEALESGWKDEPKTDSAKKAKST